MNYFDYIKKYAEEGYIGTDFTCNGKCIKCGECCGTILPLDKEDELRIKDYVFKNKIKAKKYMLVMTRKLQCPYYNGNKEKGCSIYPARPKICRYYKCDLKAMNYEQLKNMKNTVAVNMWELAEKIEEEMNNEIDKKTRETVN